ncbi:MAG: glycosyltransferase family 4 protein [Chloroflexi bacterium]|nr:glycosyltransferase family 4 protein [Chloroflexota bacterium]
MRVAIDASRCTVPRITGTERYAIELIRALVRLNTSHDITLYFRDTPPPDLFPPSDRVRCRVIPFRRAWTHLRFAAELWRNRPEVTFVPAHTLPLLFPGRAVVTVHDLGFKYFPEAHLARQRLYLDWTTRYSARRAALVLADSQATADDLTKFYGAPPDKIRVVYPGVETPPLDSMERGQGGEVLRRKYRLPERYFLFIGTLQPRKNIARIVQAYRLWRKRHPGNSAGLVLAGGQGWLFDPTWVQGVEGVYLPGYVDDTDKGALLAGALALVFPSLYEGFGFPVVEAMHVGTPVIGSNTSSLPELVGDAGLLVDPLDVEAIAAAMGRLSNDEVLRQSLSQKGHVQAAKFTWKRAAEQVLDALESAAKGVLLKAEG